ncbi:hypothetical protein NIES4072_03580 [Nostoc commune NIES-4072]|uniref:DUF4402 domain-containing protein n=1 Tax=Nostoc commune NIES-4072 TaxID=2005467 RepID=A0A2R5FE49_NOSCO|nr:hypothetical protein [Nostoc commune]BBD65963.1 hypothetical protein NIES4070_23240 [Nostoc commune HK-02]GBG16712.1 hypothetical protein NIES4072_03580 [Nostoc commune NIES-4072]
MLPNKIVSYQSYLVTCLGVVLGIVWPASSPAQFISRPEPTEINRLATPQTIKIPPIQQSEIAPAISSESVAQGDLLSPPRFNTFITRELPGIWQMRVPIEQVGLLYATYELQAQNGANNAVSNQLRSDSALTVVLEPLSIVEISRDPNTKTALVQGGVRLKMNLSNNQLAGTYSGELIVRVDQR